MTLSSIRGKVDSFSIFQNFQKSDWFLKSFVLKQVPWFEILDVAVSSALRIYSKDSQDRRIFLSFPVLWNISVSVMIQFKNKILTFFGSRFWKLTDFYKVCFKVYNDKNVLDSWKNISLQHACVWTTRVKIQIFAL